MAEVSQRAGTRAREFGLKMFKRCLLENRIRLGPDAGPSASLSAGFLFGDLKNRERSGAVGAAELAAAVSRLGSYVKESETPGGPEELNMPERLCSPGLEADLCSNGSLVEPSKRQVPLYRSCEKFWRTVPLLSFSQSQTVTVAPPRFVFIRNHRNYSGNGSRTEPLYRTKTGYYDILGVAPAATQAQIKTAYYKQSFTYHPDRNPGSSEATERFSEISEAYAVLGNKGLRRKYDRGLLSSADLTGRPRPSAAGAAAEQRAGGGRSVVGRDFRENVFDFDRFYQAHYGEQLQRQRDIRVRKEEMLRRKQESDAERESGRMMAFGVGMLLVLVVGLLLSLGQ